MPSPVVEPLASMMRGTAARAYVDELRERGVDFTVAAETEHRVSVLPLVPAGVGIAVVTDSWREMGQRAGALVLDLEPNPVLRIGLISRKAPLSPAARAFLDCASRGETAYTHDGERHIPINPEYAAQVLDELTAYDAVYTVDTGLSDVWAARTLSEIPCSAW